MHAIRAAMVAFAFAATSIHALRPMGQACKHTSDCAQGSSCVAGDAAVSLQTCVADRVCGGNLAGNCPGFVEDGPLICAWMEQDPSDCTFGRCQYFNTTPGIFKCISKDRCDVMYSPLGPTVCSKGCPTSPGSRLPCNGRGSCQSTGPGTFACACQNGWSGSTCDTVVDASCLEGVGQCGGVSGTCTGGKCVCSTGYTGLQCELAPTKNITTSSTVAPAANTSTPNNATIPGTTISPNNTTDGSTTSETTTTAAPAPHSRVPNQQGQANNSSSSHGNNQGAPPHKGAPLPPTVIALAAVAGAVLAGLVIFAVYAKHVKREAEKKQERASMRVVSERPEVTTPRENIQVL
ncbi:Aste57867_20276 [Aphanomyces stellatus]|uniref:Aste57867_20276 protein n=1 Tax=Aphanomyces stellatus TaxID=120398 RepID=A0A485LEM1_9STRA|nr:hypothetical protein As57867_020210 [Aphanomyces stellatus]VFT96966.1 Aste57867_20276 [Aphanomyces stellatus]